MKNSKFKSLRKDDRGNAAVYLLVLVLAGIAGASLFGYVALTPAAQQAAAPGAGGAGTGAAPVVTQPSAALPTTPQAMEDWNSRLVQGVSLSFAANDATAGTTTLAVLRTRPPGARAFGAISPTASA